MTTIRISEDDFRPLPGCPGYEFNCMGKIKNNKGKILKPRPNGKCLLTINGKRTLVSIPMELIKDTFLFGLDAINNAKADLLVGPSKKPTTRPSSAANTGESIPDPGPSKDHAKAARGGLGPVTDAEIRQMRKMLKAGCRNRDIVEKFKVDSAIPSDLRAGRIYKNRGLLDEV